MDKFVGISHFLGRYVTSANDDLGIKVNKTNKQKLLADLGFTKNSVNYSMNLIKLRSWWHQRPNNTSFCKYRFRMYICFTDLSLIYTILDRYHSTSSFTSGKLVIVSQCRKINPDLYICYGPIS